MVCLVDVVCLFTVLALDDVDDLLCLDFLAFFSNRIVLDSSCLSSAMRISKESPFSDWVGSGYENGWLRTKGLGCTHAVFLAMGGGRGQIRIPSAIVTTCGMGWDAVLK